MANRYRKVSSGSLNIREMQIRTLMRYHLPPIMGWWLLSKRQQITNVGEDEEKENPCALLIGMEVGAAPLENSMEVSKNTYINNTTIYNSLFSTGY